MLSLIPYTRFNRASYNPFKEMDDFENALFGGLSPLGSGDISPIRTDIKETETAFELEADLPGFKKEDIEISLDGECLTISAKRNSEYTDKDKKNSYIRCERSYGEYSRSFDVSGINTEEIGAKYENGVLTLTLPKKQEAVPEKRKLEIQG